MYGIHGAGSENIDRGPGDIDLASPSSDRMWSVYYDCVNTHLHLRIGDAVCRMGKEKNTSLFVEIVLETLLCCLERLVLFLFF